MISGPKKGVDSDDDKNEPVEIGITSVALTTRSSAPKLLEKIDR